MSSIKSSTGKGGAPPPISCHAATARAARLSATLRGQWYYGPQVRARYVSRAQRRMASRSAPRVSGSASCTHYSMRFTQRLEQCIVHATATSDWAHGERAARRGAARRGAARTLDASWHILSSSATDCSPAGSGCCNSPTPCSTHTRNASLHCHIHAAPHCTVAHARLTALSHTRSASLHRCIHSQPVGCCV